MTSRHLPGFAFVAVMVCLWACTPDIPGPVGPTAAEIQQAAQAAQQARIQAELQRQDCLRQQAQHDACVAERRSTMSGGGVLGILAGAAFVALTGGLGIVPAMAVGAGLGAAGGAAVSGSCPPRPVCGD